MPSSLSSWSESGQPSMTSHSDGRQNTIDADNNENHDNFNGSRSQSSTNDLIWAHLLHKIISDRGIIDGMYMRMSMISELRSVDILNEPVEVTAMKVINNAANISDVALASSSKALEMANLAIGLANGSAEVTAVEAMVQVALDTVEKTVNAVKLSQSILRKSRRSLGGQSSL